MPDPTDRLLAIMARLRDPVTGCDWDTAQTFATIAPYTIEEAYEVADAIQRGAMAELREELGDLLLQVVFHARIAEEQGLFSYQDVVSAICEKMESRHPHIFGTQTGAMDRARWEDQKATERAAKGHASALDGVAQALPALMRAEKLQKRAARVGFDWPDPAEPAAKIVEELDELATATTDHDRLLEAGDLLFAAVNVVRSYGISAEEALRAGNAKFEGRFRQMEQLAAADGEDFPNLTLEDQEAYWLRAKAAERS